MKIYRRADFLKLPAGTMYLKGTIWRFDTIEIKADTLPPNDWVCLNPFWPEADDSAGAFTKAEAMLEKGVSEPMGESYGRDGRYDADEIFLVLEPADLERLKQYCDEAIKVAMP